jgi:hypothetical protein
MSDSKRLARQMELILHGGAWHGPSWREALDGVSRAAAMERPIPEAHTIAEIVFHSTTWHEVVRRRLEGASPEVSAAEDWPLAEVPDEAAWDAAVARLFTTGDALCTAVGKFPSTQLHTERPGLDDTWFGLILGQLEHMLYHAGQIGLLRKAAVSAAT